MNPFRLSAGQPQRLQPQAAQCDDVIPSETSSCLPSKQSSREHLSSSAWRAIFLTLINTWALQHGGPSSSPWSTLHWWCATHVLLYISGRQCNLDLNPTQPTKTDNKQYYFVNILFHEKKREEDQRRILALLYQLATRKWRLKTETPATPPNSFYCAFPQQLE